MQSNKYSNNMAQSAYGDANETQQDDNSGNQQNETEQDYLSSGPVSPPNQYTHTPYSNQNQMAQMATYEQTDSSHDMPGPSSNLRRSSRPLYESSRAPHIGSSFSQSSIDHFDHYKRPPSRDSSVDRYARAASRLSGSRQPSIDRSILPSAHANNSNLSQNPTDGSIDRNVRAGSAFRNITSVATSPVVPGQSGGSPSLSHLRLFLCKGNQGIFLTKYQVFQQETDR